MKENFDPEKQKKKMNERKKERKKKPVLKT